MTSRHQAALPPEWGDDLSRVLEQTEAPTPQLRSEAIDQMTELLQEAKWEIPSAWRGEVVRALRERLADNNWCARAAAPPPSPPLRPQKNRPAHPRHRCLLTGP